MTELINHKAEIYAASCTSPQNLLLEEIEHFTLKNHAQSQMLSGHVQGRFLSMISHLASPSNILEIGTFTGFSALCLAEGLSTNGTLHTIELRDEDADTAESYFRKSIYKNKIILHRGNAKEVIPTLKETWDFVFIDADKTGYIDYYELTLPKIKQGGFIVADNVLFHGEVLEEKITSKNAIAIHTFNKHVSDDNRVEQVMLTMRDGLLLLRKI